MKKLYVLILTIVIVMALCLFVGCQDEVVSKYKLNSTDITLNINEDMRLELATSDGVVIVDGIDWSSSDTKIASVREGIVSAKSQGEALISAKYKGKTYRCKVTVKANDVTISDTSINVEIGSSRKIMLKENGQEILRGITWRSSEESIASVENGVISAKAIGDTIITARYGDKVLTCAVKVRAPFNAVGSFYSSIEVKEMNITFEFDIVFKEDNTYTYDRRDVEGIDGVRVNSGTWQYRDGILICTYGEDNAEMRFSIVDGDTIKSVGTMVTGGMDAELTFTRV